MAEGLEAQGWDAWLALSCPVLSKPPDFQALLLWEAQRLRKEPSLRAHLHQVPQERGCSPCPHGGHSPVWKVLLRWGEHSRGSAYRG